MIWITQYCSSLSCRIGLCKLKSVGACIAHTSSYNSFGSCRNMVLILLYFTAFYVCLSFVHANLRGTKLCKKTMKNWQNNWKYKCKCLFDLSCKRYLTVPETASSDTGIMFSATAAANDSSNSLLFLKPPPGSEIPRSASVSSALPRPRPQVDSDLQTGSYEEL